MILSLLSAQRPWAQVVEHLDELRDVFGNYEPDYVYKSDPEDLETCVCALSCGNRRIHAQMQELRHNINILRKIEQENGNCDYFLQEIHAGNRTPIGVAFTLSDKNSRYKLKGMGVPLILQYMKQLGIDCVKPDVHLKRIVHRLGWVGYEPSDQEVFDICKSVASQYTLTMCEVGSAIWLFGATGYAEMCDASPKCCKCPVGCKSCTCDSKEIIEHNRNLVTWNKFFMDSSDKFAQAHALMATYETTDMDILCEHLRKDNPGL